MYTAYHQNSISPACVTSSLSAPQLWSNEARKMRTGQSLKSLKSQPFSVSSCFLLFPPVSSCHLLSLCLLSRSFKLVSPALPELVLRHAESQEPKVIGFFSKFLAEPWCLLAVLAVGGLSSFVSPSLWKTLVQRRNLPRIFTSFPKFPPALTSWPLFSSLLRHCIRINDINGRRSDCKA